MLKKVLLAVSKGHSTPSEVAKKIKMQESAVLQALYELEKNGYLASEYTACSNRTPACSACLMCPIAQSEGGIPPKLSITKKGMKYMKR